MSVTTEADEVIHRLRVEVRQALRCASEAVEKVVLDRCHGSDEITDEFKHTLMRAQSTLTSVCNELAP